MVLKFFPDIFLRFIFVFINFLFLVKLHILIFCFLFSGNSIVVGSRVNIITTSPEIVSPIIDTSLKRSSTSPDGQFVTKKLLLTKNTTILPKNDNIEIEKNSAKVRVFKKLPALKIREVPLWIENEKEKQFLINENSPTKISESTSQGIIQINPVIHVQNAASKSTGT